MLVYTLEVNTGERNQFIDLTARVRKIVVESGVTEGICYLYVPHTTAAITINENADPTVVSDIIKQLERTVPLSNSYTHIEGNSAAHIKSTLIGSSQVILIHGGRLSLGTWQGIFFCEFDGPRQRRVLVKITAG